MCYIILYSGHSIPPGVYNWKRETKFKIQMLGVNSGICFKQFSSGEMHYLVMPKEVCSASENVSTISNSPFVRNFQKIHLHKLI